MNLVIIEDEKPAFNRLEKLLKELLPEATTVAHLDSIQQAETWFADNKKPDLVFLDIHLADGNAFDLLKRVSIHAPIIFTTAYDQYAMEAFKTSSVDYLLKPLKKEALQSALEKLDLFKNFFKTASGETATKEPQEYKKRFLIRFGEHIKTISVTDIAYFYSENKATFARTFDGRSFPVDQNLDALDSALNPQEYFRINRQYIISLNAIEDMRSYTKARVVVKLNPAVKDTPVVSSERAADFKLWLAGEL
ncbi:MAG TPA: LytTR family DNA-binding domain-containing protein [Flavipsychrobacter sp.]|nr:LytTR family DNA-binding domain-containing protein [Flavipsychrobacter sp.]